MDQATKKRSRLGSILTMSGGVLGVAGVIIMRIGLKATIRSDNHDVALIRGAFSVGGAVVFGIAFALIVAGAIVGRRRTAPSEDERPLEHAQSDPVLPDSFGPPGGPTSPYGSTKLPDERSKPSSWSSS